MKVAVIHLIVAAACSLPAVGQQPTAGQQATAGQQPTVSDSIDLPKGARLVLQAKGDGVQIYTCSETPSGGVKWSPPRPDARLLDASGHPIGTHFAGPTWKLKDGGQVQGAKKGEQPHAGSIPWLLLDSKEGTATGSLASVAFIRRTETHGGVEPTSGCKSKQDVNKTVQVPYTATYTFYAEK